jgi:hypothetical protein
VKANILIRCDMKSGDTKWKLFDQSVIRESHHGHLCRAFSFDPASTWFDLPQSWLKIDVNDKRNGGRVIEGYVFQGPKGSEPIGKLTVAYETEKFRDHDGEANGWMRTGR